MADKDSRWFKGNPVEQGAGRQSNQCPQEEGHKWGLADSIVVAMLCLQCQGQSMQFTLTEKQEIKVTL